MSKKSKTNKSPARKTRSKTKPMPSLIYGEGKMSDEELTAAISDLKIPQSEPHLPRQGYDQTAGMWMWLGVIVVALAVSGLWLWSLNIKFGGLNWSKSADKSLLADTQKDWNTAFDDSRSTDQLKTEIKNKLNTIFAAAAAASSTASATSSSTTADTPTSSSHTVTSTR